MQRIEAEAEQQIFLPDPRQGQLDLQLTAEEIEQQRIEMELRRQALAEFRKPLEELEALCDTKAAAIGLKKFGGGLFGNVYVEELSPEGVLPSSFWIGRQAENGEFDMVQYDIKLPITSLDEFASAIEAADVLYYRLENAVIANREGTQGLIKFLKGGQSNG